MNIEQFTIDQLDEIAGKLVTLAGQKKLWAFYGEMGVGKTTLIQAICRHLGARDTISSPTFSLVNEYKTQSGNTIFHFDFYRIKSIAEVYDIGYEDYFYSGHLCLIEWPERIEELLDGEDVFFIHLLRVNDEVRELLIR